MLLESTFWKGPGTIDWGIDGKGPGTRGFPHPSGEGGKIAPSGDF